MDLSVTSIKETFFTAENGKKYLVYENKSLTDAEADKIFESLEKNFPS
jgi:hypothetical protein